MEAASVRAPAGAREEATTAARRKPPKAPGTPWWLWLAVASIVIFCLFPFYWLLNISLKTGAELSNARVFPESPSLDNYTSIFQNASFTRSLRS